MTKHKTRKIHSGTRRLGCPAVFILLTVLSIAFIHRNPNVWDKVTRLVQKHSPPAESSKIPQESDDGLSSHSVPVQNQIVRSQYDNLALGVPGKADTVIDRPGYALGYNEYHEQAAWVIYKLTKAEATSKAVKRTNRFAEDPGIPTGSATTDDYRKSGYDRGHLAPAADMSFSARTMSDSFYYSNMSPQNPRFNRGLWKDLEEQVRGFAVTEKEIYVVTGPILPQEKTITVGSNQVTVPTHYYKVIYDLTPPRKMIGFLLPNDGGKRPLQEYAVPVDAVETATGLDFFSLVPQSEQEPLERTIRVTDWTWTK